MLAIEEVLVVKAVALIELAKVVVDVELELLDKVEVLLVVVVKELEEIVVDDVKIVVMMVLVVVEEVVVLVVVKQFGSHSQSLEQDVMFLHISPPQPVQDPPVQCISHLTLIIVNLLNICMRNINFKMIILKFFTFDNNYLNVLSFVSLYIQEVFVILKINYIKLIG